MLQRSGLRWFHWREFLSIDLDHSFWACHLRLIICAAFCRIVAKVGVCWMAGHASMAQMILGACCGHHGLVEWGRSGVCRDIESHLSLLHLAWRGLDHHGDNTSAM